MSDVVISAFQPFPAASQGYSTTATTIRIWYGQSFLDSDGTLVQFGTGTIGFYFEEDCTIDGDGIIHVPSVTIKATLNAQNPNPQSIQCYAQLFSNGTPKAVIFGGSGVPTGWVIPESTPVTYEQLNIYNQATVLANPPQRFWTASQTQEYFNSLDPAPDASDVVKGIGYASVAPSVAGSPVFYGANDTNVATSTTVSQNASAAGSATGSSSLNISIADSKATSDAVVTSSLTTTSNSKIASNSLNISVADSKAVSDSVVISTLTTTSNSKDTSQSILISTADSKGVSNSVIISSLTTTSNSKDTSQSILISTADSKALSGSVVTSTLTTTTNSKVTSLSVNLSVTTSTANSG